METKANYVAVGAFVLAVILGIVIALLWLAGFQYATEYANYRTSFEGPVTGLGEGTAVRYNGIDVGRVRTLDFDKNDPSRVIVTMDVKPDLRIPADSLASIASEGLTGGSYVEIDGGSKNAPILGEDGTRVPTIRSRPSTLQQLAQSAPKLVEKLNRVADQLELMLNEKNRKAISNILNNLDLTTAAIAKRTPEIEAMISNLQTSSVLLNTDLQDVHTLMGNANITVLKVNKLADDADEFVVNGGVAELTRTIAETRRLISSLSRLSNQLDKEPTKLLFGDRHKGYAPQ